MRRAVNNVLRVGLACVAMLAAQQTLAQDVELLIKHMSVAKGR